MSRSVTTLDEAINVYEEALQLRPVGHACRAEFASDLGAALWRFCYLHRPDAARSRRCIELFREAALLRPSGHGLRDQSLHRLATALLFIGFEHLEGGRDALTESVCLSREALQLRPLGHPDRGKTLNTLAIALWRCFEHYGDAEALAESIAMHRDVMPLHPPGHPDRAMALSNLGTTLRRAFDHMGGAKMLAEAIALHREALSLRPIGDPLRFNELDNLANSLWANVLHSGQSESLSEAIRLHREALNLLSEGHPERARLLASLADALLASVRDSSNSHSLDEAITLLREALLLQPIGNPLRPYSLNSLAEALQAKHDEHGDTDALKEAIILQREALDLHPKGHSRRLESLEKLAVLLQRSECQSWTEALELYREALEITPSGYPARARLLSGMSRCFLDTSSPSFNLPEGISHLARAYADDFSHIGQRLKSAVSDLRRVEEAYAAARETADAAAVMQLSDLVLHLYAEVIGLLPRAAHFGLDHDARLHAVSGSDEIARNAAARAIVLGRTAQAVEMLEEGRAIFWSQSLRLRDTGFDGVPEHNRQELDRLFRHLDHGARRLEISQQTASERERDLETRRQYNVEAEALISKIRGYPGLDRFLMPASFQALIGGLPDGIAIIVNASKLGYHALLLNRVTGQAASLELHAFDAHFDSAALRTQLPRDISITTKESYGSDTRAMRLVHARQESSIENVLARLWTSIVQPIINQLGLQVSHRYGANDALLTLSYSRRLVVLARGCGGASQATLGSFPFTPPGSIKIPMESVPPTMSCRHMCLPSLRLPRLVMAGGQFLALNCRVCSSVKLRR
jgi:tetratricopeptide (TPR) repeat protein